MNKNTLTFATVLAVVFAAGCSSNGNDTNDPSGDAGPGVDATAEQMHDTCVKACDHLNQCNNNVDLPKCQDQCGKELRGNGYLNPVTAKALFETIRDLDVKNMTKEQICWYPSGWEPWTTWEEKLKQSGDINDYPIEDVPFWKSCMNNDKKCLPDVDEVTSMVRCADAASMNKRYNSVVEEQCWNNSQVTCSKKDKCAMDNYPSGEHPWFAGVPDSFNWQP